MVLRSDRSAGDRVEPVCADDEIELLRLAAFETDRRVLLCGVDALDRAG
jgi:hypothetical protein